MDTGFWKIGSGSTAARRPGMAILCKSRDDVDDAVRDNDDFARRLPVKPARHLRQCESGIFDCIAIGVARDIEGRAELSVDLDSNRHLLVARQLRIGFRPTLIGEQLATAECLPYLFSKVRHHGSEQLRQDLQTLSIYLACAGLAGGQILE